MVKIAEWKDLVSNDHRILCYVADDKDDLAEQYCIRLVCSFDEEQRVEEDEYPYEDTEGQEWIYAVPVNEAQWLDMCDPALL